MVNISKLDKAGPSPVKIPNFQYLVFMWGSWNMSYSDANVLSRQSNREVIRVEKAI